MRDFTKGFWALYCKSVHVLECTLIPVFALILRYIIFKDFIVSGWLKLKYIVDGQFKTVVELFRDEYHTPLLSPELASGLSTFNELVFPILIMLGLMTRFSAMVILFMTAVIEFTYIHSTMNVVWAMCAAYLIVHGAGKVSLDYLLYKSCNKKTNEAVKK